jgi:hypothetical protein
MKNQLFLLAWLLCVYNLYAQPEVKKPGDSGGMEMLPAAVAKIDQPIFLHEIAFAGGTGTSADPYLVETAEHLNSIRFYNTSSFKQIAEIDLAQILWQPVGDYSSPFSGVYDGNGFSIKNLTITRPQEDFTGLFGRITNAKLLNIFLDNVNVTGNNRVGTLCGLTFESEIEGCSARGTCNARGNWAGGLVGVNFTNSVILSSFAAVRVEATGHGVGGLSGTNEKGSSIINSYASGDVSGLRNAGGLIGYTSGQCEVENCYSSGFVSAELYTGGLIGRLGDTHTTVFSYWNVETSGQATSVGGTPLITSDMLLLKSFEGWDFDNIWKIVEKESYPYLSFQQKVADFNYPVKGIAPSALTVSSANRMIIISWKVPSVGSPTGYKLYRDEVMRASIPAGVTSYEDKDLENHIIYSYSLTALYDNLESNPSASVSGFAHNGFAGGNGTENDPYQVSDARELFTVRQFLTSYFRQVADIDMSNSPWASGEGWLTIGTEKDSFKGQYDGDGHVVSNLNLNREMHIYQGLFSTNAGTILNLGITNAQMSIHSGMAGILAGINQGLIINCYTAGNLYSMSTFGRVGGLTGWNEGRISASHSSASVFCYSGICVGGLAGANSSGFINDSSFEGEVGGDSKTGGIAGVCQRNATIESSFCSGTVRTSNSYSGGLTGSMIQNSVIRAAYATGRVDGKTNVGGVVGYMDQETYLYDCYATGAIRGYELTGGLVGANEGVENVSNSFWNVITSGQSISGGGTSKNVQEMTAKETFSEWNFDHTWGIIEEESYPYLLWQNQPGDHNYPQYSALTLIANPSVAGTVAGAGRFLKGQMTAITATAATGYRFVNWSGPVYLVDHPDLPSCLVYIPDEDIVLTANFELLTGAGEELLSVIKIYPNPASGRLWVEYYNAGNKSVVQIINLLGQEVLRQELQIQGKVVIDLDIIQFTNGVYFLNILSDANVFSRKIMVRNQ